MRYWLQLKNWAFVSPQNEVVHQLIKVFPSLSGKKCPLNEKFWEQNNQYEEH